MKYLPHQTKAAAAAARIIEEHGLAYIFGEPRSGKTRAALLIAQPYERVIVFCPKMAIPGWVTEMDAVGIQVEVTNYEQAGKVQGEHDLVVIDEAHQLGKVGKQTLRWKRLKKIVGDARVLYLSGTPAVETPLAIWSQLALSKHTPLKYTDFYQFFRAWGIADPIWLYGRQVEQYKLAKPGLMAAVDHIFLRMSQQDAGIVHKAEDIIHTVKLGPDIKARIAGLIKDGIYSVVCLEGHNADKLGGCVPPVYRVEHVRVESDMQERTSVHQLESGAIKLPDGQIVMLDNNEVVDYLMATFGDTADVAYMTHFLSTRAKLAKHFTKAHLYSSTAHAEGTDLSHYRHLVVVNSGYSGSKFIQRRERGTNIKRLTPALVHHIITDGGVSAKVYALTSEKLDFNLKAYRNERTGYPAGHHQIFDG